MGINRNAGFSQIIRGRKSYHEFDNMSLLMLGKQDVNFNRGELKQILNSVGFEYRKDIVEIDDYDEANEKIDSYDLFQLLGFMEVNALDISDYEGADIIFDLSSTVLPQKLVNRYDYIFDGGVLEHIFNFPQALVNTSKMLKAGGKIIHDLPCGNLVDHGFYSFSPTCFIDYYTANHFFIDEIYLLGYQYPHFDVVNVRSADCRYNDSDKWASTFCSGYNILLVCEATKSADASETNVSFMQQSYRMLHENTEINRKRYSYEYRINKVKDILQANPQCRIAIYGTGITAKKMLCDLMDNIDNIVGLYDGKMECGKEVEFGGCKKQVLDLAFIHEDKIQYIVLGSENISVINLLRQRVKHLKKEGIKII